MSNAASLRNLALARATKLHPVHLILDDDLRDEVEQATANLDTLRAQRRAMEQAGDLPTSTPRSLADAPTAGAKADIDLMIEHCEEIVAGVEAEAKTSGAVLVVNFTRLAPAEYQVLVETSQREARKLAKASRDDDTPEVVEDAAFLRLLGDQLIAKSYRGSTTLDGEDTQIELSELLEQVCSHADIDTLRGHCIQINRTGAAVDFHQVSSGPAAGN